MTVSLQACCFCLWEGLRDRMNERLLEHEPTENLHPVVRTHPLTGRRALCVNSGFTDRIKGLTPHESKALLAMLFDHIAHGLEFQCRVRWEPQTVTMWDNRCTQHFASWDYFPETRSGWRVTTVGERPYLEPAAASAAG